MSSDQPKDKKDSSPSEVDEPVPLATANPEMTLEDLDAFLELEDPELSKKLGEIGNDKSLKAADIVFTLKDIEKSAEKDWWDKQKGLLKIFNKIPKIYLLSLGIKKIFQFIRDRMIGLSIRAKNFTYFLATDGRKNIQASILNGVHAVTGKISAVSKFFKKLSLKLKLAFLMLIVGTFGVGFAVYTLVTKDLIHTHDDLFLLRLSQVADSSITYEDSTLESFYENLRASQNLFLIPKVMVNLRRVTGGNSNPMAAFEFVFETVAPEVVLELKDREYEIREQVFRTVEKFSYNDIADVSGKKMMCDTIQREVDKVLLTGKLKKVNLKTFVLKPE